MAIDYDKLNSITIADRYPIIDINAVLSQLGKHMLFTVLDLKRDFQKIPLGEFDIAYMAFLVNNNKNECTRLLFGFKNRGLLLQRGLGYILREYIEKLCLVYIYGMILFGKD